MGSRCRLRVTWSGSDVPGPNRALAGTTLADVRRREEESLGLCQSLRDHDRNPLDAVVLLDDAGYLRLDGEARCGPDATPAAHPAPTDRAPSWSRRLEIHHAVLVMPAMAQTVPIRLGRSVQQPVGTVSKPPLRPP